SAAGNEYSQHQGMSRDRSAFFWYVTLMAVVAFLVSLMLHRKGKGMRL
ncbi:hypothetical protein ACUODJ_33865, partial [Escherichia sp. HC-CC]